MKDINKLIEESEKRGYSEQDAIKRKKKIQSLKEEDSKNYKVYDILLRMNDRLIKLDNERS